MKILEHKFDNSFFIGNYNNCSKARIILLLLLHMAYTF